MSLAAGTQLGPYEILSPLGAGGMGEVYRARDTRLSREVAIKVLPAAFSADADRLRRFEQEARAASMLNHPNILVIYDLGTHEGSPYIVSELLDGEELRAQLNQGALTARQAIDYAQQVAQGLAAAHEKGIVHRDLKPENLFITKDGRIKILDFGLAKLKPQKLGEPVNTDAPTNAPQTEPGVVMGTVGYMSPEQVRGQDTDHRSDIFSFGVILYEMLSGRRAFHGESLAETMAAIVKEEPPDLVENNKVSPQLERIVRRCLAKKPERRFQSTSDLSFALEALSTPSSSRLEMAAWPAAKEGASKARLFGNARLAWIIAAVAVVALLALLPFAMAHLRRAPANAEAIRFPISPPEGGSVLSMAVSPDGRRVAFVANAEGKRLIWVRPLGALASQPLLGTDTAEFLFWSPDSRSLGFFASGKLKKIDLSGGAPQILGDTTGVAGGAWNREGVIIFGTNTGLFRVSATGGAASALTTFDGARQESGHFWPFFLPDGQHFVFCVRSAQLESGGIYLGSLEKGRLQRLAPDYSRVAYAASAESGYLLFVRDRALIAQPFDSGKLSLAGEPFRVAEQVSHNPDNGYAFFSTSESGVLVYDPNPFNRNSQLVWLDRAGKQLGVAFPGGSFSRFRLSPNDRRIALAQNDPQTGGIDLWIHDLLRGSTPRFTFDPANDLFPIWSPDGSRIAWQSNRGGTYGLYQKLVSGMGQEKLLHQSGNPIVPRDWSTDGRFIVYQQIDPKTNSDVWALPLEGERKPFPLLQSPYLEGNPRLSPDGHWLAYYSDETGRGEVYVTTFPSPSAKWQISTAGGGQPQWRRDGKELYYTAAGGKLMAVAVEGRASSEAGFEAGVPQALFEMRMPFGSLLYIDSYNASADGQRFLVNTPVGEAMAAPLTVVVNWTAEVKR